MRNYYKLLVLEIEFIDRDKHVISRFQHWREPELEDAIVCPCEDGGVCVGGHPTAHG